MDLLVSKFLRGVVVKFFKISSVCILFQALTALKVIEFFPYKIVQNEGLNNLPVKEAIVIIMHIRKKREPVLEN